MEDRRAIAAATVSLLVGIIAVCLSCGRPGGGAGAPGVAALQPSSAIEHELEVRRQAMNKADEQLTRQMEQHRDTQTRMNELRGKIAAAEQDLHAGQAGVKAELDRKTTEYTMNDIQVQRQDLERQVIQSRLQEEIQRQKQVMAQLSANLAQQQNWGFDSPDLRNTTAQVSDERDKLASLEAQSIALQEQAGQQAALRSEQKRWHEGTDQEQTQAAVAKREQELTAQLQGLQNQYTQLDQEEEKQRNRIGDLEQQFRTARDDYQSMQAKP